MGNSATASIAELMDEFDNAWQERFDAWLAEQDQFWWTT